VSLLFNLDRQMFSDYTIGPLFYLSGVLQCLAMIVFPLITLNILAFFNFFQKKVNADPLSLQVFVPVYSFIVLSITALILFLSRKKLFPKVKDNASTDVVLRERFIPDFEKNADQSEDIVW
jgi:hypothetical protein